MTSYHIAVSVVGVRARLADPSDRNMAKRILNVASVAEGRAMCDQAEAEGLEVFPLDICDNRKPTGQCLGHEQEAKQ